MIKSASVKYCGFFYFGVMELLTIKEVSKFLKVKEPTLYSWVRNGAIPSYKLKGLLRFDMEEIREWIKNSKQNPRNAMISIGKSSSLDIDNIVKKAIDDVTGKRYNPHKRETSPSQGLRKEV